ncbi:uncharacterized protein LOC124946077 [Impatiens glandulifera]|uniref:uncharacterized protein LOC124946077 n=1 Tax=Impatiens glandulifera TaxID=253017 RepID=UPI001FB14606|nr:uncharacterized protein LOC124946077 [Impatiens glandulifera]
MAAASPALSNNSPVANSPNVASAASAAAIIPTTTNSSRNLRGLNKPKCIQCGNVARSRCPYQSCKSCCAKAQNPCHIHVLKNSSTFPDKAPAADSATFDQKLTEASPSGSSHRLTSLRQLSNNFAQFNNLQSPLRSKKPLTRKDAANINEWRFKRLKEFKEQNIELENKAFDRYMHNVCLLEEVFSVNSKLQSPPSQDSTAPLSSPTPASEDNKEISNSELVLKLRSDTVRTENFKRRLRDIVDDGLRKLKNVESDKTGKNSDEPVKNSKEKSLWGERSTSFNDLLDKLSKARNNEDLKSCLELKRELFNDKAKSAQSEAEGEEIPEPENEPSSPGLQATYNPPKWFCKSNIDQDDVNSLDLQFPSLESIGN